MLFALASSSSGFPPAPYYTLYGTVRDQVGQSITEEGAVLILLKAGEEVGRTPIGPGQVDQNYELRVRIDQNRSGTTFYTPKAVASQGAFSVVVQMGGALFYPIEVTGTLTAGNGGERIRLDLNLGGDADLDGLPDVWEEWQLYQAGYFPDANGNWPIHLITRDGDFDGDGFTNWQEYVAGTFAGDATDRFDLEIKERLTTSARLEFYGITGKTYTLERTTDAVTWTDVAFSVGGPGEGAMAYTATNVGILTIFVAPVPDTTKKELYRMAVQ